MNNFSVREHNCNVLKDVYGKTGIDTILLTMAYVFTSLVIIMSNAMVIYGLYKTKQIQNRSNKLFIVLSISDIIIGGVSMPAQIIKFTKLHCVLVPYIQLLSLFPALYSYTLIVLIAIDRYVLVRHTTMHQRFLTAKCINITVSVTLLLTISAAVWYGFGLRMTPNVLLGDKFYILLCVYEVLFGLFTSILYIKLLFFVKKQIQPVGTPIPCDQNKKNERSTRTNRTIAYIFLSLIICYFTHAMALLYIILRVDENFDKAVLRNILCWAFLAVTWSSAINAIIFLIRNRRIMELYKGKSERQYSSERSTAYNAR